MGGCTVADDAQAEIIRRQAVASPSLFPSITRARYHVAPGTRIEEQACQAPCPRVELDNENSEALLLYSMLQGEETRPMAALYVEAMPISAPRRRALLLRAYRALRSPVLGDIRRRAQERQAEEAQRRAHDPAARRLF